MTPRKARLLVEESIKSNAIDLDLGETAKDVCPFCNARHEESFSVTRTDEGILYNCYRAGCSAKGFISSLVGSIPVDQKDIKRKEFKPKVFDKPLEPLPSIITDMLFDKYELTREELDEQGIKFCRPEYRLFMPTFDFRGNTFGGVSKTLLPNIRRFKTINYFVEDTSRLHYPRTKVGGGGAIAVVEDILSSIKVSRHIRCVAALGHSLSIPQIQELRQQTDSLVLMLDADVFSKAITLKKKYSLYFRNFLVIYLSNGLDPKDLEDNKLREVINEASCV